MELGGTYAGEISQLSVVKMTALAEAMEIPVRFAPSLGGADKLQVWTPNTKNGMELFRGLKLIKPKKK